MQIIEYAKSHPKTTAAVVFGVGVVIVLLLNASGDSAESVDYGSGDSAYAAYASQNNAYNAQLAQQQIGAQVATTNSNNALAAQVNDNETAFKIAQLNFQTQQANAVTAAQTAAATIDAQKLESTLKYSSMDKQTAANISLAEIAGKTSQLESTLKYQTTQAVSKDALEAALRGYDSADKTSANALAGINSVQQTNQAQIAAQLKALLDKQAKDAALGTLQTNNALETAKTNANRDIIKTQYQAQTDMLKLVGQQFRGEDGVGTYYDPILKKNVSLGFNEVSPWNEKGGVKLF